MDTLASMNPPEDFRLRVTRVSMEVIVTIVSKLGYFTYSGDLQPTFIGVK